jgi:hypothetical protein
MTRHNHILFLPCVYSRPTSLLASKNVSEYAYGVNLLDDSDDDDDDDDDDN